MLSHATESVKSKLVSKHSKAGIKQELQLSNDLAAQQASDLLMSSKHSNVSQQTKDPHILLNNIKLDLYDRENVFTECVETHFISNDFEQHSLISSQPLQTLEGK